MNIKSFSKEKILKGIESHEPYHTNRIRLMYVDEHIHQDTFETACKLYSNLRGLSYDDVIIIERFGSDNEKLLPMVSNISFVTSLGEVPVNDQLRNDFCDEDDDFFIDDSGLSENMCIYDQLMMLQCVLSDFNVLSIQIADQRPSIIRELATAVSELMRDRNALVIVCSNVSNSDLSDLEKIETLIKSKEHSKLLNYLNTGDAGVIGPGPLAAGVLIAENWELENHFITFEEKSPNFLAGCGMLQNYKRILRN
jgi:AmmeMemoRadiSam system protein B